MPDERLLDLGQQTPRTELDDVVALRLAVVRDEVDDDDVALARRTALDRRQLGDRRSAAPRARLRSAPRAPRAQLRAPRACVQSATSGMRLHGDCRRELERVGRGRRKLVVVLGRLDGPDASSRAAPPGTSRRCGSPPPRRRGDPCRPARAAPASAPCPCGNRGSSGCRRDPRRRGRWRARRRRSGPRRSSNLALGELFDRRLHRTAIVPAAPGRRSRLRAATRQPVSTPCGREDSNL